MTILQSKLLSQIPNILHGFTTRDDQLPDLGNVSFIQGDPDIARRNRREFSRLLGVSETDLTLSFQEHGTVIREVRAGDMGAGALTLESSLPPADGLVTSESNLPLAIMVADCACLLMANKQGQVVGAFHAGWRGVFGNMALEAIKEFEMRFELQAKDLVVWISPMICANCFEVGAEVWELFHERWGPRFLRKNPLRIDLLSLLIDQLSRGGVPLHQVETAGLCTFQERQLFSHRRGETPNGRMMGVIARKK